MAEMLAWYAVAAIGLFSALMVVTLKNVMHSALFLALAMLSVAGAFMLLGAEFLAIVQVMLYAGGITVLILFAVFLTQRISAPTQPQTNENGWVAFLACLILGGIVLFSVKGAAFSRLVPIELPVETTPHLGKLLLSRYILPFEVASVVLLAAMVGVVIITSQKE